MSKSKPLATGAPVRPPEQVTLVYRHQDGAHSFSLLEVPGLIVLDHDLERAYGAGLRGVGELITALCNEPVEYDTDLTFAEFKKKVDEQKGTANRESVVTIPGHKRHVQAEHRPTA